MLTLGIGIALGWVARDHISKGIDKAKAYLKGLGL